jgi:hypothetical protein
VVLKRFILLLAEIPGVARDSIKMKELEKLCQLYLSFTPRPFHSRRKSPRYSFDRRLGGPQNRPGRCGEEKHLALAENPTPAVQPEARRAATDTGVIRILHFTFIFQLNFVFN